MFSTVEEKLTQEQELIVRRCVNSAYFDADGFVDYLSKHEIVDFDIFAKNCKKKVAYSFLTCYHPIARDLFIDRLNIYFYDINCPSNHDVVTDLFTSYLYYAHLIKIDEDGYPIDEENPFEPEFDLEPVYQLFDKIAQFKIPLKRAFDYLTGYFGRSDFGFKQFLQWVNYVELLDDPNENNVFPSSFYYAYNIELEKHNQGHRMVMISTTSEQADFNQEKKKFYYECGGYLPVDSEGKVRFDWVGIWLEKCGEIKVYQEDQVIDEDDDFFFMTNMFGDGMVTLQIEVNQESRIFILNRQKDAKGKVHTYWKQVYGGACVSEFSFKPIIDAREKRKLSQKDVAELADINLRSYQRMEAGESTPDGLALISLMSVLNIQSTNAFKKEVKFIDDGYTKFLSGKEPSEFLEEKEIEQGKE